MRFWHVTLKGIISPRNGICLKQRPIVAYNSLGKLLEVLKQLEKLLV